METNGQRIDREVAARNQLLKKVIGFAKSITRERGKELHHTVGFGHVHTIRELHNADDFSFLVDTGQSIMGGNEVTVWYHQMHHYKEDLAPVLNVWWQLEIEECKLTTLNADRQWQRELLKIIERREEERRRLQLAEKAKRLQAP